MGYPDYTKKESATRHFIVSINLKEIERVVTDKSEHERHIRTISNVVLQNEHLGNLFVSAAKVLEVVQRMESTPKD